MTLKPKSDATYFLKGFFLLMNSGNKFLWYAIHKEKGMSMFILLSRREKISQPGIEQPTPPFEFGYLSIVIRWFRVISNQDQCTYNPL